LRQGLSLLVGAAVLFSGCARSRPEPSVNKRIAERYFGEILSQGRLATADEILAPAVRFTNPPLTLHSREELKQLVTALRGAFPDLRFHLEDALAEGDRVATRWTMTGTHRGEIQGKAATGKSMSVSGMDIFRIADGRIQEIWVNMDVLGQAQQLGWMPGSEGSPR
jgi:steroid delta-isomerase-like uncharacterized protein